MKLKGKVAIVTGAGSGNGQAMALELAREGAKVALLDRTGEKGKITLEQIEEFGGMAMVVKADVSQMSEMKHAVAQVISKYGKVDILCNNAGIFDGQQDYLSTDEDTFNKVINVNLKGVFIGTKLVLEEMIKQKSGVIINTASVAGIRGGLSSPAYTASKHGVIGLTRDAAAAYGKDGIRAIAICPGMIKTAMTEDLLKEEKEMTKELIEGIPLGRVGEAEEIGKLVSYLVSDDANYISGTHIVIDGAMTT